jgi:hypothetical protein
MRARGFVSSSRLHLAALGAVAVACLSAAQAQAATNCNSVTSRTILPPVRINVPVYVTLQEQCGSPIVPQFNRCRVSFLTTPFMTIQDKCEALVKALTLPDPRTPNVPNPCVGQGFTVTDNCGPAPLGLAQLTIVGNACTSTTPNVSLGISNDPSIGNQETTSASPIPDYEAEIITPVCVTTPGPAAPSGAAAPTASQPALAEFLFRGAASGTSFVDGAQPAVSIVADSTNIGGGMFTASVNTTAGMTALTIATTLSQKLQGAGFSCSVIDNNYPGVRCTQPDMINTIGFTAHTTEATIGIGNGAAPVSLIDTVFTGKAGLTAAVPAVSGGAFAALAVFLAAVGLWILRKQRVERLGRP